jgi:hypothetical protein
MVIGHVDHDLVNAVARKVLDEVFHHGLAQEGDHGFW